MTAHHHLVPRLRMSGAIVPLLLYDFMMCVGIFLYLTNNQYGITCTIKYKESPSLMSLAVKSPFCI
jgi:hypothetical protein